MNVHEQTMKVHDFMNKFSPGDSKQYLSTCVIPNFFKSIKFYVILLYSDFVTHKGTGGQSIYGAVFEGI